jgi:hypothetical protein
MGASVIIVGGFAKIGLDDAAFRGLLGELIAMRENERLL